VRTHFPDIYEGMLRLQQEIDANGQGGYISPKEQMQLFQQFMKTHSERWGDIMKMMQDMLQDKIRRGEVQEEELRRETIQILSRLAKMDKHDRKDYLDQAIKAGKVRPDAKLNMTMINNQLAAETMKQKLRAKLHQRRQADVPPDTTFCDSPENVQRWKDIDSGSGSYKERNAALDALVQSIESKTPARKPHKPRKR
jgi:hypothetical protein